HHEAALPHAPAPQQPMETEHGIDNLRPLPTDDEAHCRVHGAETAPPTRSFSPMNATVGLVVGREWSFPPKFIEEVNGRDRGVLAEYAKLGAERMDAPSAYAVIIDRISHEVPFYRTYLKHAVLQGVAVVNN